MPFELYEKVRITAKDVIGTIIDFSKGEDGHVYCIVESDTPGYTDDPDAYPGLYPMYYCLPSEIERI